MTVAKLESPMFTRPLVDLPGFSSLFASSAVFGLDVVASHSVFRLAMIRSIDVAIATTQLAIVNQWDDSRLVLIMNKTCKYKLNY